MTLGFRVKTGWAAAVLIAKSAKAPALIDSRVIELSDPAVADSRQPYHAGFGTEQTDTAKVTRLRARHRAISLRTIAALLDEYRTEHRVRRRRSSSPRSPIPPRSPTNTCARTRPKAGCSAPRSSTGWSSAA